MFGADMPIIMLRYCEAVIVKDNAHALKVLRELMEEREAEGLTPSLVAARAWRLLAVNDLEKERYDRAVRYSDYAEKHIMEAAPDVWRDVAEVLVINGITRIVGSRRSEQDIEEAYIYFDRAIDLFPAQDDIETFDALLAITLAWQSAAKSAASSDIRSGRPTGTHNSEIPVKNEGTSKVRWTSSERQRRKCKLEWVKREPPEFPYKERSRESLGAVLIGYDVSENGAVMNERVLAEVPGKSMFGDVSLQSMASWELKMPTPTECRRNRLARFNFTLSDW